MQNLMKCGELIQKLKQYPSDKPIVLFTTYTILEGEDYETINDVSYPLQVLDEYDEFDDLEFSEDDDFVAIFTDAYVEIIEEEELFY